MVDFGISLGKIVRIAVPRRCGCRPSPLTSVGHGDKTNIVSDICELDYVPQLKRLALWEAAVDLPSQSSNEDRSPSSSESDTVHFNLDNLSTEEIASTSDSIPDLEDHMGLIVGGPWRTRIRRARAARLHLPVGPTQVWRNLFRPSPPEHEGQPWREVLGFMVNEQRDLVFECVD